MIVANESGYQCEFCSRPAVWDLSGEARCRGHWFVERLMRARGSLATGAFGELLAFLMLWSALTCCVTVLTRLGVDLPGEDVPDYPLLVVPVLVFAGVWAGCIGAVWLGRSVVAAWIAAVTGPVLAIALGATALAVAADVGRVGSESDLGLGLRLVAAVGVIAVALWVYLHSRWVVLGLPPGRAAMWLQLAFIGALGALAVAKSDFDALLVTLLVLALLVAELRSHAVRTAWRQMRAALRL